MDISVNELVIVQMFYHLNQFRHPLPKYLLFCAMFNEHQLHHLKNIYIDFKSTYDRILNMTKSK